MNDFVTRVAKFGALVILGIDTKERAAKELMTTESADICDMMQKAGGPYFFHNFKCIFLELKIAAYFFTF